MSIEKKIAERLGEAHETGTFDGVALVAKGDTVLYRGAWGLADRERKVAHRVQAPFPICSITKQFTALLVMQQVAAGKLKVDGLVTEYLPDFRASGKGDGITLRHLLMHTSGLPQWEDLPGALTERDPRLADADYMTRTFGGGKLLSKAGEAFRYNNLDYLVLASILEAVTRRPYTSLLNDEIIRPLKLTHTGLISARHPRQVVGYEKKPEGFVSESPSPWLENFGAAGAMYSTVEDLWKWDRALDADKLLPRPWREIMFTSDPAKGYTAFGTWVYGYQTFGNKKPMLYERQGGIGGLFCQNLRVPEDQISLILLSNVDSADLAAYTGKSLTCDLLRLLYEAS